MSLKKGLIIVILVLAFLAAILFFGNSVAVLATIILFMLGYSYFKWKNKHMAEEEIKAVVVSYLKPDIDWPSI
ncbi:MAG TPA: hypothetical protein VM577_10795, partial [Anaerovoracaceae bacterium]|nr:hypothetical protein [Anaerovoracaceae bacterium]